MIAVLVLLICPIGQNFKETQEKPSKSEKNSLRYGITVPQGDATHESDGFGFRDGDSSHHLSGKAIYKS
ncbi:MAG: hypothetical protein ACI4UF_08790 [Thermoguttaceae bacterium]